MQLVPNFAPSVDLEIFVSNAPDLSAQHRILLQPRWLSPRIVLSCLVCSRSAAQSATPCRSARLRSLLIYTFTAQYPVT